MLTNGLEIFWRNAITVVLNLDRVESAIPKSDFYCFTISILFCSLKIEARSYRWTTLLHQDYSPQVLSPLSTDLRLLGQIGFDGPGEGVNSR